MPTYLDVANDPILWILAFPLTAVVAILAITFTRKANKVAHLVNLTKEEQKIAFRSGAISAIGPALGVFIVMLGLISKIGGPLAWQRLSVIGAAHTELTAAEMAANAMGSSLESADYGLMQYANACWVMALNGSGWLIVVALLTDRLDNISYKLTKGDTTITAIIATAGMCGAFSYLAVSNAIKSSPYLFSAIGAGIAMIILNKITDKYPRLKELNLGFALIIGMIIGTVAEKMM